MSDAASAAPLPTTAGGLLRRARQAQGLHIAALAAAIKVVPRKLELLESDQFDQLPDATFTRALAQTVCRSLKIDAAPILALLPPPSGYRLEHVSEGLNTPFRERPGRVLPKEWASVTSPALWLAGLLVIAAAGVYMMPAGWLSTTAKQTTSRAPLDAPGATIVVAPTTVPAPAIDASGAAAIGAPVVTAPASAPTARAEVSPSTPTTGVLQVRATAQSWVEVTDARGRSLIARLLEPGESVGLDGAMPMKLRVGNASATQVVFRGQPLELAAYTRDNVARLELK
jgi:cytoskeleton protein RodZ